jgi:hypothetical protein
VVSLGNNAVESPCATGGSVIGRVSVADASLSLSLSLSALRRVGPSVRPFGRPVSPKGDNGEGWPQLGRGQTAVPTGPSGRVGFSRRVPRMGGSSAAAGSLIAALMPCPRSRGSVRVDRFLQEGWTDAVFCS